MPGCAGPIRCYFGSKERLILDVLDHEQRRFAPDPDVSTSIAELRAYVLEDWATITCGEKRVSVRILEQVFGAACGQDSPYAAYTAQTLEQLIRNFEARLLAVGMPAHIATTRAIVGLTALQGFVMRYFTAEDPTLIDREFLRLVDEVLLAPY